MPSLITLIQYNYMFALLPLGIRFLAFLFFIQEPEYGRAPIGNKPYHIKWMARYVLAMFIGGILLIPTAVYEVIEYLWPYAFPPEPKVDEEKKAKVVF